MNRFSDDPNERSGVIDVHQHVWPESLIEALRARRSPPRLRGWTLELAGEPDYEVDPRVHDPGERAELARSDGLDLALVSLSSPLGIESLAPEQAVEVLAAYHEGALALPAPFGAWAAACLTDIDADALVRELERGFVGLQLPATALLDGAGYDRAGPLLDVLEEAGLPLMIHPGPVAGEGAGAGDSGDRAGQAPHPGGPQWSRTSSRCTRHGLPSACTGARATRGSGFALRCWRGWRRSTASGLPPAPATAASSTRTCSSSFLVRDARGRRDRARARHRRARERLGPAVRRARVARARACGDARDPQRQRSAFAVPPGGVR